jgi:hypothetical protein
MGRFWSIFFNETFRMSYWNIEEQFTTLKNGGGGGFEKITIFPPDPLMPSGVCLRHIGPEDAMVIAVTVVSKHKQTSTFS